MNFYNNIPPFNINTPINSPILTNDIQYKIQELELKIKKLEQRIILLETNNPNNNKIEPDNTLYMI